MSTTTPLESWKTFIKGRIAEESGNFSEAIEAYDQALKDDPTNVSFLRAKTNALLQQRQPEEASIDTISRGYAELASELVGENDKHKAWIQGLTNLLGEAEKLSEKIPSATERGASLVAKGRFMVW